MTIPRQRTYIVDPSTADSLVTQAGLTIDQLAGHPRLGLGKKTIRKLLRGQPVYMSSLREFARFFGVEVGEILQADQSQRDTPLGLVGDWQILAALGPVEQAANGLQFRRYKLCRTDQGDVLGRAKRFFLDHLSLDDRSRVQEHLLRHTNVCNQVGLHPNIARHYEIKSDVGDNLWWVIDAWIVGRTLEALLSTGPLEATHLPTVMRDIAEGLRVLHSNGVVLRQLSPSSIVIREDTGQAVLLDFEMAKLLGRRPTVSPDERWPEDDYRAPEIGGATQPEPSSDAYSWARVLLHACTGRIPPPPGDDLRLLERLELPRSVKSLAANCLAINRRERPRTMKEITRTLGRWRSRQKLES